MVCTSLLDVDDVVRMECDDPAAAWIPTAITRFQEELAARFQRYLDALRGWLFSRHESPCLRRRTSEQRENESCSRFTVSVDHSSAVMSFFHAITCSCVANNCAFAASAPLANMSGRDARQNFVRSSADTFPSWSTLVVNSWARERIRFWRARVSGPNPNFSNTGPVSVSNVLYSFKVFSRSSPSGLP